MEGWHGHSLIFQDIYWASMLRLETRSGVNKKSLSVQAVYILKAEANINKNKEKATIGR